VEDRVLFRFYGDFSAKEARIISIRGKSNRRFTLYKTYCFSRQEERISYPVASLRIARYEASSSSSSLEKGRIDGWNAQCENAISSICCRRRIKRRCPFAPSLATLATLSFKRMTPFAAPLTASKQSAPRALECNQCRRSHLAHSLSFSLSGKVRRFI